MKLVVAEGDVREEFEPEEHIEEVLEIYFGMRERPVRAPVENDAPGRPPRIPGLPRAAFAVGLGRGGRGRGGYRGAPRGAPRNRR